MSNIDKRALREAAEKATPGRIGDRIDGSGSIKYQCFGNDGSLVLQTDHKNMEYGFIGGNNEADELFFRLCDPSTVLALLDEMEAKDNRIAELESDNAYIKNRHKELDLLIGKNILVMQAAIIEWQGTGDARKGLAWIYNTLFGPGELPDESEKDAQAYFDRKYGPLDEELMALHRWFWEQSEAERAAAGKGE